GSGLLDVEWYAIAMAGIDAGHGARIGGQAIDEPGSQCNDQHDGDQGAEVLLHAQAVADGVESVGVGGALAEKAVRRRWRDRWRQSLAGPERYDGHDALSEISLPAILTEWAYPLKAGRR